MNSPEILIVHLGKALTLRFSEVTNKWQVWEGSTYLAERVTLEAAFDEVRVILDF